LKNHKNVTKLKYFCLKLKEFPKTQAISQKTHGKWTKNSMLLRINPQPSSTKLLKKPAVATA